MRVAVVSNLYPPDVIGGYELLARDVVEGLRARGHEVDLLTSGSPAGPEPGVHRMLTLTRTFVGRLVVRARLCAARARGSAEHRGHRPVRGRARTPRRGARHEPASSRAGTAACALEAPRAGGRHGQRRLASGLREERAALVERAALGPPGQVERARCGLRRPRRPRCRLREPHDPRRRASERGPAAARNGLRAGDRPRTLHARSQAHAVCGGCAGAALRRAPPPEQGSRCRGRHAGRASLARDPRVSDARGQRERPGLRSVAPRVASGGSARSRGPRSQTSTVPRTSSSFQTASRPRVRGSRI
jgi:hypothetical protein